MVAGGISLWEMGFGSLVRRVPGGNIAGGDFNPFPFFRCFSLSLTFVLADKWLEELIGNQIHYQWKRGAGVFMVRSVRRSAAKLFTSTFVKIKQITALIVGTSCHGCIAKEEMLSFKKKSDMEIWSTFWAVSIFLKHFYCNLISYRCFHRLWVVGRMDQRPWEVAISGVQVCKWLLHVCIFGYSGFSASFPTNLYWFMPGTNVSTNLDRSSDLSC